LAKSPSDRYASASELAQLVQGWQEVQRRQAEDALRQSEALYHSLVDLLPVRVWRKDLEGRFTFVNKWFCDASGLSRSEIVGKTDFELSPPDLAEKYREDDRRVIATGKPLEVVEELLLTASGEKRHVHTVKMPIFDAQGVVVGTQGIFWDVTEQMRLQNALNQVTGKLNADKE
jgi:PAS domain S-box-containing protein